MGQNCSIPVDDDEEVEIKFAAGPLGVLADTSKDILGQVGLRITEINSNGLAYKWNEEHMNRPTETLEVGDFILEINGQRDDGDKLQALLNSDGAKVMKYCLDPSREGGGLGTGLVRRDEIHLNEDGVDITYFGDWKVTVREGQGIQRWIKDKRQYSGSWVQDRPVNGIIWFKAPSSDDKYIVPWARTEAGAPVDTKLIPPEPGQAELEKAFEDHMDLSKGPANDCDVYVGRVVDFKAHGKGTYYSKASVSLEAEAKRKKEEEEAQATRGDKSAPATKPFCWRDNQDAYMWWVYDGLFAEDQPHGKGKEIWQNGESYDGDYNAGKKHGKGIFIWPPSGIKGEKAAKYAGDFNDDVIEGSGKYEWSDGRTYTGGWKENKMDGEGTFTWPDGRKYVGSFQADQRSGKGTFDWPDGRQYVGPWKDGVQHGEGKFRNARGQQRVGFWKDGQEAKDPDGCVISRVETPTPNKPMRSGCLLAVLGRGPDKKAEGLTRRKESKGRALAESGG